MRNSIFKLAIVALSLGLSACAGQLQVEEPLEVSAPDLDALNAMSAQAASEDPENSPPSARPGARPWPI